MLHVRQRAAKACERCRHSKKKCEGPSPCRQCRAAGEACVVRERPRPSRQKGASTSSTSSTPRKSSEASVRTSTPVRSPEPLSAESSRRPSDESTGTGIQCYTIEDPFERMNGLMQDQLGKTSLDFEFHEPQIYQDASEISFYEEAQHIMDVNGSQIRMFCSSFEVVMQKLLGPSILDFESLVNVANLDQICLSTWSANYDGFCDPAIFQHLDTDSTCLLYICLAIGAHVVQHPICHRFHSIARELAESIISTPSFKLCCFYYLQHDFILRIGSCKDGRAVLGKTVQIAHSLGLDRRSHGSKGLHLYLITSIADQYSALTHGLPPLIHISRLSHSMFEHLLLVKPELKSLVDLVLLNCQVIDRLHQSTKISAQDIILLEAKIGQLSIEHRLAPSLTLDECDAYYESFARIHMLYCRLSLRISMIDSEESWGDSMTICCSAAKNIISLYYQIFTSEWPQELEDLDPSISSLPLEAMSMQSLNYLPRTWRQVRRIFLALFVIVYAYCHGEMARSEALEYLAKGRALLDYQRCKWGTALDNIYAILEEIYILVDGKAYDGNIDMNTWFNVLEAKPEMLLNTAVPNIVASAVQTVGVIATQLPMTLTQASTDVPLSAVSNADVQDLSYQLADWNWEVEADETIDLDAWAYDGAPRVGNAF